MQLRHMKTIFGPNEDKPMTKVTAICWSANNKRLAVCTVERVVTLYDDTGERRDKFSTKPADKGPKNYIVRAMQFSPDSTKLAIAQSDNIVFIYKIGLEWGDKKSICNKFHQSSPITTLVWPCGRPNEVVYGLAEGKVKVGQLKNNKPATLYSTDSYVTALASNVEGNGVVSAHLDGSIFRFLFDDDGQGPSHMKLTTHPCPAYSLGWGQSILVAGNDGIVTFYDFDGGIQRTFDYQADPKVREFTCAATNPTGDAIVVGNFDRFHIYAFDQNLGEWEEAEIKEVENMYNVSALGWKSDGSKLALGALCGVVDLYDACIRRYRYKGRFEFTYVSLSQVIVKRLSTGQRIVLRSHFGCEITKVNIYQDRYVVAHTVDTLLLGDLETFKLSEVEWFNATSGGQKFILENPAVCLVYQAGELSLIEYGKNDILGAVRTDYISAHLISVVVAEKKPTEQEQSPTIGYSPFDNNMNETKTIAYLLDNQTICLKDFVTNASNNINHDSKVDWLELNNRGNLLLFRDKRRQLHLYDVEKQVRSTLLNYCTYVQWVPESDVVVAQNRSNLNVWYNIHAPDQVTVHQIKGDVEEIWRGEGRTEVIVDEGIREATYLLDEGLIQFGTALEDKDLKGAMDILEAIELTPDAEAMWAKLSEVALASNDLKISERCAAALGDVGKARYLHKVNKLGDTEELMGGMDHWSVRSKMALLNKDVPQAEGILLAQGKVDEAIEMYQMLHRFEDAIKVAEDRHHPEAGPLRQGHFKTLIDSGQEARAAAMKEQEGDYVQAINLYLKGNLPSKAATVVQTRNIQNPAGILEQVASALTTAGMHGRAGEFYEQMGQLTKALESYKRGNAFKSATELARRSFPNQVVMLQEMWGDFLVEQKQVDMAINHYIEANASGKAIDAALSSRQWTKAGQLVEALDKETGRPYYRTLARHYKEVKAWREAEKFFVLGDAAELAVEMYTSINMWDAAHKLAVAHMSPAEVQGLYIGQAQKLEEQGKLKEAEKLYLTVEEVNMAISMYKNHRKYDAMIRLVSTYRKELLKETHQFLAQQLEMEGNLREAEHHYAEAGEWLSAVNMYRSNDMWDEAIRVAKVHGGAAASKRVAYAWALALGGEAGAKLLDKLGLIEPAIEYATDSGAFDHAFELARACCKKKIPEIHLKYALFLEDEEKFADAEEEFIKANKPREAIDMYLHQQDWPNALRVAESYDPSATPDVYVAQGHFEQGNGQYQRAEQLFLSATKPDVALAMYQEAGLWQDALRVAQTHLPHKVGEVQLASQAAQAAAGTGGSKSDYLSAGKMWEASKQWSEAIDAYLNARAGVLQDPDDLEEIWDHAVQVAKTRLRPRYMEVVREVAMRLREVGKHETAADILREADLVQEAVDTAMQGEAWDKARDVAGGHHEMQEKVAKNYETNLVTTENAEQLVEIGQTEAALDVLAQRDDWDRLWTVAQEKRLPLSAISKYIVLRVNGLLQDGGNKLDAAVRTLRTQGTPTDDDTFQMYQDLVKGVLGRSKPLEEANKQSETVSELREVMFSLVNQLKNQNRDPGDMENLLMACHYSHLMNICREKGMLDLALKISITLLRYSGIIPSDKCFYIAGALAREKNENNLAFVLLNRYVDLTEAIEEGDLSLVDNADFADATAVPFDENLPPQQYLAVEDDREEVRDWVLSVCMDAQIEQALPSSDEAKDTIYDGLFATDLPTCIVTGYPVRRNALKLSYAQANKTDWNTYVRETKLDPWTSEPQNPQY
mmetsp:Transcript_10682/g.13871  ORF Transcript_10682/g.13871 Transcript_10682/m.13871 type:complete len:1746 (-) Transcript_10682:405-5642(-)